MQFYTVLLAVLLGLSSFQMAEAKTKHPKSQHSISRSKKVKNSHKFKKTKVKRAKR